jgi:hypothetical protein
MAYVTFGRPNSTRSNATADFEGSITATNTSREDHIAAGDETPATPAPSQTGTGEPTGEVKPAA